MYTEADINAAAQTVKTCRLRLLLPIAVLLIGYVVMTVLGVQWAMLLFLLAAFVYAVFYIDTALLPAMRYKRFLQQIGEGLRRETEAEIVELQSGEQMQDGARVRPLCVKLADGDERLFWVNVRKAQQVPEPGTQTRIESCGRHVTAFRGTAD